MSIDILQYKIQVYESIEGISKIQFHQDQTYFLRPSPKLENFL